MASQPDNESKTEEATEGRRADERKKGNTPQAREMGFAASLAGLLAVVTTLLAPAMVDLGNLIQPFIESPDQWTVLSTTDLLILLSNLMAAVGRVLAVPLLVLMLFGLVFTALQGSTRVATRRIAIDWSRVSPISGARRLFGKQGGAEFLKSTLKLAIFVAVAYFALREMPHELSIILDSRPDEIPKIALRAITRLLLFLLGFAALLALVDLVWGRIAWARSIRMTKEEVKDEHRNAEGDPLLKGRLRMIARERSRRRMIAAVPRATLVVVNPTHYAVAIRYVRAEGGAPVVLAKGRDLVALKIRGIAEQNGIAIIEDKALARSLHDSVKVDQMIPPQFYKAIAQIIIVLNRKAVTLS